MDYVTRQFINLTKHFRKDLRKALSDLNGALHKQTESIRESYQVRNDKQSPPPEVTILNNLPSSIEVCHSERDAKHERNYKRFMFLVTTLTLGAIVIYADLVYWQYRQMIEATDAATRSANAATQALKDSETHFRLEQRSYMVVHDPILAENAMAQVMRNGTGRIEAVISNAGRGVAFDEHGLPVVRIIDFPTRPSLDIRNGAIDHEFEKYVRQAFEQTEAAHEHIPLRDIVPEGKASLGANLLKRITPQEEEGILSEESVLVFMGLIKYKSFGETHETEFCWFYGGGMYNPTTKGWDYKFMLCQDHNTIR